MEERASRLQSAYGELVKRKLASTKKDIAEKMGASAPNVSSAFNGDPRVLTDRFLSRFNAAYGNLFSLEWLLTGKGEMLKESVVQQTSYGDHSPNVNGDGNHFGGCASIDRAFTTLDNSLAQNAAMLKTLDAALAEIAAQRELVAQSMAQTAMLIQLLQNQK